MTYLKVTAVAAVLLVSATALEAAPRKAIPKAGASAIVRPSVANGTFPEGTGTLTYDNNTPFARSGVDGSTVGNKFDTAPDPHGIATATFRLAGNDDSVNNTGSTSGQDASAIRPLPNFVQASSARWGTIGADNNRIVLMAASRDADGAAFSIAFARS